jgi:EmrB/QacA subfamily drug resistance transporter
VSARSSENKPINHPEEKYSGMETSPAGHAPASYNLLIVSISLAVFMSALDGSIVNIALPTISEAFNISSSMVSWVSTAYLLVMAGCVLVFGKIADVIGFKKMFLAGFVIFTSGSVACGLLPDLLGSFYALVISRMFQAIGGAMITAIAPAMITAYIPMDLKGKAMGIVMTLAALGTAIGPVIGGFLTQYLSWHWIFFINIPVGILAVLLGIRVIPGTHAPGKLEGFDKQGAALIFTGLATLLYAVSEGQTLGWTTPVILVMFAIAVVSLGLFIRHELRTADPLLELNLFRDRNFLLPNLVMSLVFFSFAGINYLLPFYLEYVRGYTTSDAGMILTSLSVAMMAAGILSGLLYNRFGPRILSAGAGVILSCGYFLMTRLHTDTGSGFIILALMLIGFGLGLMVTPVSNVIMQSVSKKYGGMVSSLTSLERFAPLTLGIAFFNLIFIQGVVAIAKHGGVTREAPRAIQMGVLSAGFDFAFLVSFILGIVILILAIVTRPVTHPDYLEQENAAEPGIGMI